MGETLLRMPHVSKHYEKSCLYIKLILQKKKIHPRIYLDGFPGVSE